MNNEIQKNMLLVQLKILKELRQLNKTITNGIHNPYTTIYKREVFSNDFDDVREAMAIIGVDMV